VVVSLLWMLSPGLVFGWFPLAIVCGCVAYGSFGVIPALLTLDIYAAVRRKMELLDLAALVTCNLVGAGFLVLASIFMSGVVLY
jgi:hypothetical protein